VLLSLAGLSACGGDESDEPAGGLSDALDSVSAGPASERHFAWSDVAAIRRLAKLPDSSRDIDYAALRTWSFPLATGAPPVATAMPQLAERLRLDYLAAGRAVTIGVRPDVATRFDGVDGGAVQDALRSAGAREQRVGDHTALSVEVEGGEDGEVDFLAPALLALGDRAVAEGETVAFARDGAALPQVLGDEGEPLGDRPPFAAAAACLEDVVSADLYAGSLVGRTDAEIVAVGVRDGDAPLEVLCAIGDDGQAERAAQALRERFGLGATTPDTRQRVSTFATDVEVDTGDAADRSYARAVLTLRDDRPRGFLQRALAEGVVPYYLGARPR